MDASRDRGRGLIGRTGSPFLIVNPRSGDSEPSAEELVAEAERRGIGAHTLGPGDDVAAIARDAAESGASARLDEGCLHAYVVEAVGGWRLVGLFARALSGRIGPTEGWVEWTSKRFEVAAKRPRVHVAIDGEPEVLTPPLTFEICSRALRVLVPGGANLRDAEPSARADN